MNNAPTTLFFYFFVLGPVRQSSWLRIFCIVLRAEQWARHLSRLSGRDRYNAGFALGSLRIILYNDNYLVLMFFRTEHAVQTPDGTERLFHNLRFRGMWTKSTLQMFLFWQSKKKNVIRDIAGPKSILRSRNDICRKYNRVFKNSRLIQSRAAGREENAQPPGHRRRAGVVSEDAVMESTDCSRGLAGGQDFEEAPAGQPL